MLKQERASRHFFGPMADFETGRIKGATFFSVSQRFRSEVVSSFQKPFKPCHRHCRPFRIAVTVTPLSTRLGDSAGQGREVEPLWRAGPTTLPAGQEHGSPLWLSGTMLILTRRKAHECASVTQSDFGWSGRPPPLTAEFPSLMSPAACVPPHVQNILAMTSTSSRCGELSSFSLC